MMDGIIGIGRIIIHVNYRVGIDILDRDERLIRIQIAIIRMDIAGGFNTSRSGQLACAIAIDLAIGNLGIGSRAEIVDGDLVNFLRGINGIESYISCNLIILSHGSAALSGSPASEGVGGRVLTYACFSIRILRRALRPDGGAAVNDELGNTHIVKSDGVILTKGDGSAPDGLPAFSKHAHRH